LYILVEEFLKIPQMISKMSLKTSGALHYQGSDGIHVKYDSDTGKLNLYWGEAKMYANLSDAVRECFDSIKGFLLDPISANSVQERDLQLITANVANNINNEELEDAIVQYFDKDNDLSNNVEYKGVCFIGFDSDKYPAEDPTCTTTKIIEVLTGELQTWHSTLGNKVKKCPNLSLKEIHVFMMPFPSVAKFREYYLKEIK